MQKRIKDMLSTTETILLVLWLAFCIFMAIFFALHPVYTEEERKAKREEKKQKKMKKWRKNILNDSYDPLHKYLEPLHYLGM